jgi:hypothetical protein
MASVIGGGKYLVVYTATLGSSPTIGATPVLTLSTQLKTQIDYNATEPHKIDIEHITADQTLQDFIDTYVDTTQTSELETVTFEDGTKSSGTASGNALLLIIKGGSDGVKNKIYTAVVKLDPTSGSYTQEGNKYVRVKLAFNSVNPGGVVTVPTTYYTGIATTPGQITFGLGSVKYGKTHNA